MYKFRIKNSADKIAKYNIFTSNILYELKWKTENQILFLIKTL